VSPANGTGSVSTAAAVTATFPRAMLASSITASSFTLSSSAGAVLATVAYDSATTTATLTPNALLSENTTYTAKLTTSVTAQDGASLYQSYAWTFSTGVMPPTVTGKTPGNNATGVALTVAPTATFSRAMDATTINGTTVVLSGSSGAVAAAVAYDSSARVVTITPSAALASGATYTVQLSSGIKSQDGLALAAVSWSFTTASSPPTLVSTTPAAGATGTSTATTVTATFSRDMKTSTLTTSTMTLTGPSGGVAATVTYDGPSKTATLTPTTPLASGTAYTASVSGSVQSSDGVPLGSATNWTFTTTTGLEVRSTSPAAGATDVSMSVVPTVQMSKALDAATVTATNVKLIRPDTSSVPISVAYNSANFTITITPGAPLDYSGKFTIRLETGITAGGVPLAAQFNSTFTTVGTGVTTRVDAGSTTPYTATNGNVFSADTGFVGGTARTVTNTITGTTDPTLYKTERNGTWQYSIPVPNGTYDLKLHFVELTNTACNTRVFSVDVLNTTLANDISGLDIFCEVGANKPDVKTLTNVPVLGRSMRLKAVVSVGTPEIAAIEIIPHAPTAASPTPAAGATGVAVGTTVSAAFSQAMDATSLTASTVTLSSPGGAVAATVAYDSTAKAVTLTPSAPLAHGATYTARLDGTIRDSYGVTMGAPYTWTFTTG
jgi:methionine-rich copper-binding protein CopC